MSLDKLRLRIDEIDKKLVTLLNQRTSLGISIAGVKRKAGKSSYSPERERDVFRKIALLNKGPLGPSALEAIYREIMSASLALGSALKIAYLGPEATFTHLAAMKRFGSQVEFIPCNTIADVFLEVERNNADFGVVPIENSIEGAVSYTLDMFVDSDLRICSQIILDVQHNLLANCPKEKINRIYSHPLVFGQCRIWLQENLIGAEKIEVSSTTSAARMAAKEKNSACIASLPAAAMYKLKPIAVHIEDSPHNITRFFVIGKTDVPRTGHDKTSIAFSIKDKVGALYDMLQPFKKHGINLTKIESRPSRKKPWDYYFFVDLSGHKNDEHAAQALAEIQNSCTFFKILGSYPIGE
ncbi:MAG: prephenate dehydratase [Candidatus Omnitrophica bacterium]|nr:prephenate dehydratase [Candidatus Omnitrophota bacterium]